MPAVQHPSSGLHSHYYGTLTILASGGWLLALSILEERGRPEVTASVESDGLSLEWWGRRPVVAAPTRLARPATRTPLVVQWTAPGADQALPGRRRPVQERSTAGQSDR